MTVQSFATYLDGFKKPVEIIIGDHVITCSTSNNDVILSTVYKKDEPRLYRVGKNENIGTLTVVISEATRVRDKNGGYYISNPIIILRTLNDILHVVPKVKNDSDFAKLVNTLKEFDVPIVIGYEDAHTTIQYVNHQLVITTSNTDGTINIAYFGDAKHVGEIAQFIVNQYYNVTTSQPPTYGEVLTILKGLL